MKVKQMFFLGALMVAVVGSVASAKANRGATGHVGAYYNSSGMCVYGTFDQDVCNYNLTGPQCTITLTPTVHLGYAAATGTYTCVVPMYQPHL